MNIGIIGLGKMGLNIALNLKDHQYSVKGYDLNEDALFKAKEKGLEVYLEMSDFLNSLGDRKLIWVMVPCGEPTEVVLQQLLVNLSANDVVIEGGNSNYKDSIRRATIFAQKSILFLDVGTSGGVSGARGIKSKACLMVGGDQDAFNELEGLFKILGGDEGYLYSGRAGSGHFLKMVHNGIEYGMMQAIGEGFHLLEKSDFDFDLAKVARVWNHGSVIRSWLIELTEAAFNESPKLEEYRAVVAASGEGQWTVETALEMNVAAPIIAMSMMLRSLSQEEETFGLKVVAALRNQFGGHSFVKKEEENGKES